MIKWWYNRWILTGQMLTFGFVWACLVNNSNGESVTFGMKTIMNWWYRYTVCPIFRHHIFCLPWGTVEIEWIDASLLAWTFWTMWEPKCRIGNSTVGPQLKVIPLAAASTWQAGENSNCLGGWRYLYALLYHKIPTFAGGSVCFLHVKFAL